MMNGASAVDLAALRGAIARPIEESEAEIGVALRHVESGMEVLIDADARYPMASVFKISILVEALARVGEGRQALDTRVGLRAEDRVPPLGVLVTLEPGLRPTLKDLLMLMIVQSDNMATDAVLGLIGLESVERRMRALGLPTISVKMSVRGLFAATFEPVCKASKSLRRTSECLRRKRHSACATPHHTPSRRGGTFSFTLTSPSKGTPPTPSHTRTVRVDRRTHSDVPDGSAHAL